MKNCDFCHYSTEKLTKVDCEQTGISGYLCDICLNTYAGNAFLFPRQYENKHIMAQISYISNLILEQIKEER